MDAEPSRPIGRNPRAEGNVKRAIEHSHAQHPSPQGRFLSDVACLRAVCDMADGWNEAPTREDDRTIARAKAFIRTLEAPQSYTTRGYDNVAGEYRYCLTIVLARGEQAIISD